MLPGSGLGGEAAGHVQRLENVVLDIIRIAFTAGCLNDQAEQVVISVAVFEF